MSTTDRDERLADILACLLEQAQHGETPQVELYSQQHPDLAAELRELWATAQFAEDFAGSGASASVSNDGRISDRKLSLPLDVGRIGAPPLPQTFPLPQAPPLAQIGDYTLVEKIGEGGMGIVFKARQRSLDRLVALKMIQRGALASENDLARFRAEAAAAAQLEHAHIVPVYEVGEHDGSPWFSMKHVAGTTLARKLAEGPLPPRDVAVLLLPICRAVSYAHNHGIVHRDLKPSNILIDDAGQPHVSDFGLAKRIERQFTGAATEGSSTGNATPPAPPFLRGGDLSSPESRIPNPESSSAPHPGPPWLSEGDSGREPLTRTGAILGTPAFMSPEQAAGSRGEVGPASDIYSLGAILYHCLTGRPPFQAASPLDVVLMVLEQDPVLPRILNPKADPELEMIALKCMQKPPELRYGSAGELADDLAAYLANEPISARSTKITQLVSRIFRETHHAGILENWGLLWMWHSLVLLVLCVVTNWFQWRQVEARLPYLALWVGGMGAWAAVFWSLRRRAGPITFIERQIAHVWGASMVASSLLFAVETLLGMPVLTLSPVLPLIGATVFVIKAGILSGAFYVQAIALFATALVMAWIRQSGSPDYGLTLYGVVSAISFFVPGLKYYRRRVALTS